MIQTFSCYSDCGYKKLTILTHMKIEIHTTAAFTGCLQIVYKTKLVIGFSTVKFVVKNGFILLHYVLVFRSISLKKPTESFSICSDFKPVFVVADKDRLYTRSDVIMNTICNKRNKYILLCFL